MRASSIISSALLFAASSTAWPTWWDSRVGLPKQEVAPLDRRQLTTPFPTTFTGVEGNTATTVSSTRTTTGTTSNSNSRQTGSVTGTASSRTSGGTSEPTTQTFNAEDPAGGVTMITPAATATTYYKIKDYVTFAWNYTSLSVTPSYVDILASCSANQATYTIALNQSVSGPTQAVTWDTGAYQASATLPLLTETYTLIIYDAQKAITAAPQAGYLATYEQFTFGMYLPQPYTPLDNYVCATCNGAMSAAEVQTLWFLLGTAGITVLSFGWFTGVAGLW